MHELTYADLINEDVKKPISEYKYNGKDDSILYDKVISPLCQMIVNKWLPETLAPNTITVFGFFFNLVPFILLAVTDDGTPVSPYLCVIQGLAILVYSVRFLN